MYLYNIFILIQFKAQTFTEFIPNYKKKTNISQINQPNIQSINNNYYENQINILNNQLIQEKNKNQLLINENNNLKLSINNLNNKINKLKDKIKLLENSLSKKNMEIQNYMSNNNNKNKITSIKPGEEILGINFVSMGIQGISNYNLVCKNTDLFVRLEERLYEDFPQFKEYETYFEVKTRRIKRFKTLKENNIKTNDVINVFIIDN